MTNFSDEQQIALAVVPKITGTLSLLGSTWIVVEVITQKKKRNNVYSRLILAMSSVDILADVSYFASTWAIPAGTDGIAFASGTDATCSVQGFILQFNIATPIYNSCLALYYLLVIKYKVSEDRLEYNVEPAMHIFSVGFGLLTAVACAFMGMYHNANLWCWIAAAPACPYDQEPHQIDNWQHYEEKAYKCEESKYDDDVDVYRLAFYFGPLWLCMVFITVTMGMLICTVSRIGCSKKSIASCLNRHKNSRQKANTDSRKHENDSVEEQSEGDEQSNSSISGAGDAFKRQKANSNSRNHENNSDEEQNGGDEQSNISISGARDAFKSDRRSSFFIPAKKKKRKTPRNENTTHVLKVLESFLTASQQAKNSQSYGSRVVYKQAIYYTLAFYATFTFATINRVFQHFGVSFFPFILLHSFTIPLQGFFNLVIYRYFHFVRLRQRNPYVPFRILLQWTFRWTFLGPPPGARRDSSQKFQSFELPNNGKSTKSRSFGPSGAFDSHNCEYSEGSDSVVDDDAELERMPRIEDEFENSFGFDYTPSAELAYEYHTTRALNNPAQYPSTLNNVPTQYPTMVTDFDSDN